MKYSNDTLFFVAAPFGNYLKFKKKANVLPVTGTWTLKYRGGILKKIYKIATTLRYKRKKEGWVNKMGLPNVGLNVGLRRTCLLYTSPSPRDSFRSRMPSSA